MTCFNNIHNHAFDLHMRFMNSKVHLSWIRLINNEDDYISDFLSIFDFIKPSYSAVFILLFSLYFILSLPFFVVNLLLFIVTTIIEYVYGIVVFLSKVFSCTRV